MTLELKERFGSGKNSVNKRKAFPADCFKNEDCGCFRVRVRVRCFRVPVVRVRVRMKS